MNPNIGTLPNPLTNAKIVGDGIEPDTYHKTAGERGKPDFIMSRGNLVEFDRCPSRWINGYESEETKASEWGSLIDALALDGHNFDAKFAVIPETYPATKTGEPKEWNWNATYCKEWRDAQGGKQVVKHETHQQAQNAIKFLFGDPQIGELIKFSKHQVMVMGEYRDEETGLIIPLKALLDLVPDLKHPQFGKCLADLKTCNSAAIYPWTKSVFDHSYHVQAALYLDLYTATTGEDRTDWLHVLQESFPPWQVGKRLLSAEFVELGRLKYVSALRRYCQCLKAGQWPGYEDGQRRVLDGWSVVEPAPYMVNP